MDYKYIFFYFFYLITNIYKYLQIYYYLLISNYKYLFILSGGRGRGKKKQINKPANDSIQGIQEQTVIAGNSNKISKYFIDFINQML